MDYNLSNRLKHLEITGQLNLSIEETPEYCRQLFKRILKFSDENFCPENVSTLELPTAEFGEAEDAIFSEIEKLKNLKFCILKGKKKIPENDGLRKLPENFGKLACLSTLDLCFNSFSKIPKCLSKILTLSVLNLDHNILDTLEGVQELKHLTEFYGRCNKIIEIPCELVRLQKLSVLKLSSNSIKILPSGLNRMKLKLLDLSNNLLKILPKDLFLSESLQFVHMSHNELESFPESIDTLPSIELFDVQFNFVGKFSEKLQMDQRLRCTGNVGKTKINVDVEKCDDIYEISELVVNTNYNEWKISPDTGANFILPCGVQIVFPRNFADAQTEVLCSILSPNEFKLPLTDQLLSLVLELCPSGLHFKKPILLTIPYEFESCDEQKREIIMRTSSQSVGGLFSYEDLSSTLIEDADSAKSIRRSGKVKSFVHHFSMFAVIARLIEDTAIIRQVEPRKLISTVEPLTRLNFQENSVTTNTRVTIKLLSVCPTLLYGVTREKDSHASSILHVSVSPLGTVFRHPVSVHLTLPSTLQVGGNFDISNFRLLKCAQNSTDWIDVTENLTPTFSTFDAKFQVDSFCKFWLVWKNVCGVARLVYQRLLTCKVQFLAMQENSHPNIVVAQCVRTEYVKHAVDKLHQAGYIGYFQGVSPYTTEQELTEGEKFRIKLNGDIQLEAHDETYKKHLETKVLVGYFHKQYHPDKDGFKRFPIEPKNSKGSIVNGYISFYRVIPALCHDVICSPIPTSHVPETSKSTKRSHNDQSSDITDKDCDVIDSSVDEELAHLDDVLISLEQKTINLPEEIEHKLNFGDLGEGMFRESNLRSIASRIGSEWPDIGYFLELSTAFMDRLVSDHPGKQKEQIFRMLHRWAQMHCNDNNCVDVFTKALADAGRTDLAQSILKTYCEGAESFKFSMKRRKLLDDSPKS